MRIFIRLKSGYEFDINCDDVEITKNGLGAVTNIKWTGIRDWKPLVLDLSDIELVLRDMREEHDGTD